jgi:tRNA(Ile)-lysidine synthase
MADSRKRPPTDLAARIVREVMTRVPRGARVCVALSGGVDSMVLLDVLSRSAMQARLRLSAMHVHHGISRHADEWARFCQRACARRGVLLAVARVDIGPWRKQGIEAAARIARYRALVHCDAEFVALAHHRDDQAETVLLQLLRGAGLSGLAGMAPIGPMPNGVLDAQLARGDRAQVPLVVRPMLGVSRAEIESYATRRRLQWVRDDANFDERLARNFLRRRVMPLLDRVHPEAAANVARAARHLSRDAALVRAVGRDDLARLRDGEFLRASALAGLDEARGHNALRTWLQDCGVPMPDTARFEELWRQLVGARADASVRVDLAGASVRRGGDRIALVAPAVVAPPASLRAAWSGERPWPLPALGGVLAFARRRGAGLARAHVQPGLLNARVRQGGERLRLHPDAPSRSLKNLFQECSLPAWERAALPLVYCGERLACVPGVGIDAAFRAGPREWGWCLDWKPTAGPIEGAGEGLRFDSSGSAKSVLK